jgi:hypothetical protein
MKRYFTNFRLLVSCLLFLMVCSKCDTERNVEDPDLHYFIKYYGGDDDQRGVDMLPLSDGSMLLLGNYSIITSGTSDVDIYLVRVDARGDMIWQKRFSGSQIANAKDLEPSSDGNFVILADFQTDIGGQTDLKLLKVSPDGMPLDSVTFGTSENDYSRTVTLLDDGGFIVSGTTQLTDQWVSSSDPGLDPGDTFSFRFDQNLDPYSGWGPDRRGFGATPGQQQLDVAVRTIQIPAIIDSDGDTIKREEFYVFGYSNSNISGNNNNLLLGLLYFKRQSTGTTESPLYPETNTANTEIQFVQRLAPELGSGFVAIGTRQNPLGFSDIYFARFRSSLAFTTASNDIILSTIIPLGRNIRGVSMASSVVGGSGYLILGNEVRGTGAANFWLSKVDQSGVILWSSTFGSEEENDFAAAVHELPDGKIVILGTMGLADNQSKMALIKVNPNGALLK